MAKQKFIDASGVKVIYTQVAKDIDVVDKKVAANKTAIDTLNGTGDGSVDKKVATAIAGVVANAPEKFDTLKEVADWIANDKTGAINNESVLSVILKNVNDSSNKQEL